MNSNQNSFHVAAFYRFFPVEETKLSSFQEVVSSFGKKLNMGGLVILAKEGINGTVAGTKQAIEEFFTSLSNTFSIESWDIKISLSEKRPFPRFKVRLRDEIVTTGVAEFTQLTPSEEGYLNPKEWHEMLQREDVVLIDTRNWYETEIGIFENAIDPKFVTFQEFPEYVDRAGIEKDKTVMMYCTGGIRCEKASLIMKEKGYKHVFQLKGGILKYLEEFPDGQFKGECFVFDNRVAVDNQLEPTKTYALCPHYGQPAKVEIVCENCGKPAKVLERCLTEPGKRTCSKNCAYHVQRKLHSGQEKGSL